MLLPTSHTDHIDPVRRREISLRSCRDPSGTRRVRVTARVWRRPSTSLVRGSHIGVSPLRWAHLVHRSGLQDHIDSCDRVPYDQSLDPSQVFVRKQIDPQSQVQSRSKNGTAYRNLQASASSRASHLRSDRTVLPHLPWSYTAWRSRTLALGNPPRRMRYQ